MRLVIVLLAAMALLPVDADAGGRGGGRGHSGRGHSHHHFHHGGARVFIGTGVYLGYPYYYYPYYDVPLYPPAPIDPYWYYCRAANAYYPYVQSCPGGWERYLPGTPLG